MPASASQVFDYLNQHPACAIDRHEIASTGFGALRRSLLTIVVRLREVDDAEAQEISDRMRTLLSEWLTVPVPLDGSILAAVETLGEPEVVGARWGRDIRLPYEAALQAARNLPSAENPVRVEIRTVIRELRAQGRSFKIYCHRRARPHFESLLNLSEDAPLADAAFLHSVKDYRDTEPFEVLIKVGPLRSRGWGSAPDALETAPRFHTLIHVVWAGCGNEPGFGYDPAGAQSVSAAAPENNAGVAHSARSNGISWTTRVTRSGEDLGTLGDATELDEFKIFRESGDPPEKRRATLVQINETYGILYPPHSRVLSFIATSGDLEPIGNRIPGETLLEGMFVVQPLLEDTDLGGLQAAHGHFSQIWKAGLIEEYRKDPEGLSRRLRKTGVDLVYLHAAIEHWCEPPTTVIHAPQQRGHFELLIQVLGIDFDDKAASHVYPAPWWHYAWNEIRRSRGEAIQAGFQGHEIIEDELLLILEGLVPEIRLKASQGNGFTISIPDGQRLKGVALFHKVRSIEEGFLAPDAELKCVRELNTIEQWRV